jgi:succinate dehydrogenase / fumarate reductase membrane anchor subunit
MTMRTPLGRVRGYGSAKSGTESFWHQRLTAVANVPLTIVGIVIVVSMMGRNHAAVAQILGSPLISIILLLYIFSVSVHMRIGMQVVLEDYVHGDRMKLTLTMLNTFFSVAVGLAAAYAILKLSFGV